MPTNTGTSDDASARGQLLVALALVSVLTGTIVFAAGPPTGTQLGLGSEPTPANSAEPSQQLRTLHDRGVTGRNVTVAVLDPTGFDTGHPALQGRVVDARSFADGEGLANGGANDHGTAAAAVVSRTAPDASLVLATYDTAGDFRSALAWLLERGVDVVVSPGGFYGRAGDGTSPAARAAARAAREGVVFVASAGNLGEGHWRGTYEPDPEGVHEFQGGTRNYLLGDAGTLRLWVSWDETVTAGSFRLELYRTNGSASRLVARSEPFAADERPNARIVADVDPEGTYYVLVRGPPTARGATLELSSPTHALQYRSRARSVVPPATADDVLAVGAYEREADRVASYSSAGPVGDGRLGVDVVAPARYEVAGRQSPFVGSSAAAARTAGLVALLLQANPALGPATVEGVLRTTARDVGPGGPDALAGSGLIRPRPAVERGRNATQSAV